MKLKHVWGAALVAALWAATAGAQAPDLSQMDIVLRAVPGGPVASVRGHSINAADFNEQYQRDLREMTARSGGKALDDVTRVRLGLQVLGRLVEDELLYQEAQRRKLDVPAADFEKAWQNELKLIANQTQKEGQKAPSEAELLQRAGTTREAAQAELRRAILVSRMREQIAKDKGATVSDAEVDKFIKENAARFDGSARYRVRHILIRPDTTRGKLTDADKAKARTEAEQALGRIRSGMSFEAVAKEVSDGPRKEQGGDMGMLRLEDMGPVLSEAAKKMKPGEVSGIIESEYGYHIIQLVEMEPGGAVDTEKLKPRVRQYLMSDKADQAVKDYVRETAEKSNDIRIYLQLDKQIANRPDLQKQLSGSGQ